jgi:cytochrome c-type biogenesis protein CcmH
MTRLIAALCAVLALAGPALAVLPSEQLANPKLEARARRIGAELRCLVCQNETIDESEAPLAGDLRVLLRQRLTAGDTDRQAIAYIVARYGHFVLLKPPFEADTLILWLGPFLVLVLGGIGVAAMARGGVARKAEPPAILTPEEEAALARRLEADRVR